MKSQRFVIASIGVLLLCFGVRFALSQTSTPAVVPLSSATAPSPRMYADLSLSFSQEALVDATELERAITAALAKQNIAIFEVAVSRGKSTTIVFKSSEDSSEGKAEEKPPHVRLFVGATNNPHLSVGVYNYDIGLSEIREGNDARPKPVQCQRFGVSSNYSLQSDVVSQIPQLVAQYDAALAKRNVH